MNFYPHHIGDYLTATAHLTWLEDCAYRRLLDVYYSREQAIPADVAQACRLVRALSKDERKAVATVLHEFFQLQEAGWAHTRCEAEIVKARAAAARAAENGKKGGRPPKHKPTANPEETQPVISGNPDESKSKAPITNPNTKDSEADASAGRPAESLTKAELWSAGKSLLRSGGMPEAQCGAFVGKLCKDYEDAIVIDAVREAVVHQPADAASYLKSACQRLSGQRKPNTAKPSKHAGFQTMNYREGVNADGSLA